MAVSFVGATQGQVVSGGNITLTLPSAQAGDCVIVTYSVPRAITMTVTTSQAANTYTQLSSTVITGNLNTAVFKKVINVPGQETQAICTGSGNAQDGQSAVAFVFRGANALDVAANSTLGSGTTPNSPAVTAVATNDVIISAVGSLAVTATPTAPSSYLNNSSTSSTDTRSTTTAMSWVTSTNSGSNDPTGWSAFTSAAWVSFTIALIQASTTWYPRGIDSSVEVVREARTVKISEYF